MATSAPPGLAQAPQMASRSSICQAFRDRFSRFAGIYLTQTRGSASLRRVPVGASIVVWLAAAVRDDGFEPLSGVAPNMARENDEEFLP